MRIHQSGTLGRRLVFQTSDPPTRFTFPFTNRGITAAVPASVGGCYLLLDQRARPMYLGSSDQCLREHLLGHPLRDRARQFSATVADGPGDGYLFECYWWHRYRRDGVELINTTHPARCSEMTCPFCHHAFGTTAA